MSAYMVSDRHIAFLAEAAREWGLSWRRPATVPGGNDCRVEAGELLNGEIGAILEAENARSVNYRYGEEDNERPYTYRPSRLALDPVVVIKAVRCYEYQACECDDWEHTEARRICAAIIDEACTRLPGYEEAPWGID